MQIYVLVNNNGEFICKKGGEIFISRDELIHVVFYKHLKNLQNHVQDAAYWNHRNIPIRDFQIRLYEISLKPVDN